MEFVYDVKPGAKVFTALDNTTEIGRGAEFNCLEFPFILMIVRAPFSGTVMVLAQKVGQNNAADIVSFYEASDVKKTPIERAHGPGTFIIPNVGDLEILRANVVETTPGGVTVDFVGIRDLRHETHAKNVLLGKNENLPVKAQGWATAFQEIDISNFPFQYIGVRADGKHYDFRITFQYGYEGSASPILGEKTVINAVDVADARMASDWIEAKGNTLRVWVYNDDSVEHTFNLFLMGVR